MRAMLSLVGLLVVVFIVVQLARTQWSAVQPMPPAAAGSAAPAGLQTRPQQRVIEDLNKALQQGQQNTASAVD